MSGRLVVKRYAKALLETSVESGEISNLEADMHTLNKILNEAPSIREYCLKSHTKRSEEMDFVRTAFVPYVEEFTARTILIAVGNGRISAIPFLPAAFSSLLEEEGTTVSVLVESARKLESSALTQIKVKMTERTGKKVNIKTKIIPEILGGFRITWQNKIIDMSALGRLRKIRHMLK